MKNPFASSTAASLGLFIGRFQLGMYFILEAGKKFHDGLDVFATNMAKHIPSFIPADVARGMLMALPFVQMGAGICIVFGLFTRFAAVVAVGVLLCIAGTKSMFSDPVDVMFHHTLAFLGMALLLSLVGGGQWTLNSLFSRLAHTWREGRGGRRSSSASRTLREPAHA